MEEPPPLRERKRNRTRSALEAEALALFTRQGYEATTVDEIAEAAEVSRRTFFRYFGSKEDVVFGYEDEQLEALREAVRAHPGAARDFAALGAALTGFAESLTRDYAPLVERARLVAVNPPLARRSLEVQRLWENTLATELAALEGRERPDLSLSVAAACGIAALNVAVRAWFGGPAGRSLLPIVTEALEQVAALGSEGRAPGRSKPGPAALGAT